jgi:hypothetical protein
VGHFTGKARLFVAPENSVCTACYRARNTDTLIDVNATPGWRETSEGRQHDPRVLGNELAKAVAVMS